MVERIHESTGVPRPPGTSSQATRGGRRRVPAAGQVVPTGQAISPSRSRRLLDIVVAVTVLGLVFPFFLVLAVVTRLSTGGTAIYRQRRVGEGGIPFTLDRKSVV